MVARRSASGRFLATASTPAEYREAARSGRLTNAYAERMARALEKRHAREATSAFRGRASGHRPTVSANRYDQQRAFFLRKASEHTGRSVSDLADDPDFNAAFVRAFGTRSRWA